MFEVTRGDSNRSLKNYGFLYHAIFSSRVRMRTNQGCENGVFGGEECLSLKMEPRSSRHRSNPCAVLMGVKQEL